MSESLEYTNQNSLIRYPFKDSADLSWTNGTTSDELPNTIFTDAKLEISTAGIYLNSIDYVYDSLVLHDSWTFHFSTFDLTVTPSVVPLIPQVFSASDLPITIEMDMAALSAYFRAIGTTTLTFSNPTTITFCASTCTLTTPVVTSITLNNTNPDGTAETIDIVNPPAPTDTSGTVGLAFNQGTNMQLTAANGGMTMDVIAGAGQGLFDACESFEGVIYTINNIAANAFSNFGLTSDPCFSVLKATTPSTVYPSGTLMMQSDDSNYYNLSLTATNNIIRLIIDQTHVTAVGSPPSSLTLLSTDGNYYTASLTTSSGVTALVINQTAVTTTPNYSGLTLLADNSLYYPVTLTTTGGSTTLVIGQTSTGPGWAVSGLQLSNLCQPPCTSDELNAFAYYLNRVKSGMLSLADYLTQVKANYDQLCIQYSHLAFDKSLIQPSYLQVENTTSSNRKQDYHSICCGIYSPTNNALPMSVSVGANAIFSLVPNTSFVNQDGVKQRLPDSLGFANRVVKCNSVLYYNFVLTNNQLSPGVSPKNDGDPKYDIVFNLSTAFSHAGFILPVLQAIPNFTVAHTCINRQGIRYISLIIELLNNQALTLSSSLIFTTPQAFTITGGKFVTNKTVETPVTSAGVRNVTVDYSQEATCTMSFTCTPGSTAYYDFVIGLATPLGFANKTVRIYM